MTCPGRARRAGRPRRRAASRRSSGRSRARRPCGGAGHDGQVSRSWCSGLRGVVMAPSRQSEVPQRRSPKSFPKGFPTEKFLRGVLPGHGVGTLIWERSGDTLWEPPGRPRRARRPSSSASAMGVAPAGVAPLAVVVEVVARPRLGRRAARASRSAAKVVEKRTALGGELAARSRGCGRGPAGAGARSSLRRPSAQAVRTKVTTWGRSVEALELGGRADRVGQPRRAVGRLGGVLGDVGGDRGRVGRCRPGRGPGRRAGHPSGPGAAPCPPRSAARPPRRRRPRRATAAPRHLGVEPRRRRPRPGPPPPSARSTTWRWTRPRRWNSTTFM